MKKFCLIWGLVFLLTYLIYPAAAQENVDLTKVNRRLDVIASQLEKTPPSEEKIELFLQENNQTLAKILQKKADLLLDLATIQKRINALGELPENESGEPVEIARQRKLFNLEADKYKAEIAQADLIKTKIDEINSQIVKIRNQELFNQIMVKQISIFQPTEVWLSVRALGEFFIKIAQSPLTWYEKLTAPDREVVNKHLLIIGLILILSLIGGTYLSRTIKRNFGYRRNVEFPSYAQKVGAAIGMIVGRGIVPAIFFGAFLIWLVHNKLLAGSAFGNLLYLAALYLLYYYLAAAIIKVTLTPSSGKWRIIEVCDRRARKVCASLLLATAAVCGVLFLVSLAQTLKTAPAALISLKIVALTVKALAIILVLHRFFYDPESECIDKNSPAAENDDDNEPQFNAPAKLGIGLSLLVVGTLMAALLGYVSLSEFIINHIMLSALVIGAFYVGQKLLIALFHQILRFKFWRRSLRIGKRALAKTEFWFALILSPICLLACGLVLLSLWGVSVDIMLHNFKNFLIGFDVGGVHISITSILLGILCFALSMYIFKLLRNSFDSGNLSKIEMNEGIRSSIVSLLGFFGFIFSFILAIAVMGGSLRSITIIAGALSFGAGLGLQNVVSNLVAGLTILFERPIKVGDWVIVDGQEGIVKKINMRSTELETWSKSNIIIPNAAILSQSVVNLTYSDRIGRIEIKVGVDYDSDIALVTKTLLEIAQANPKILPSPAPTVAFTEFGDSSLNFQLNCFTANIYDKSLISNELRERIILEFRAKNINIPSPQKLIYIPSPIE